MKPAPFDYVRVGSLGEAAELLAQHGDAARVLAGGQSLLAMLNMRLLEPSLLVDIGRATDAGALRRDGDAIEIGATRTQSALLNWVALAESLPLLAAALPHLGHFQTRNKGTVCGSIAHADPASELPLCLALLDGEVELYSRRGRRRVRGRAFFRGLLETDRAADELIAAVRFPVAAPGDGHAFREMAGRHGDFAIVAVAVRVGSRGVSIGIGGGTERPEVRDWPDLDDRDLDEALNRLAWEIPFSDDVHASASYRRHLVRTLGRQAVQEARACAA